MQHLLARRGSKIIYHRAREVVLGGKEVVLSLMCFRYAALSIYLLAVRRPVSRNKRFARLKSLASIHVCCLRYLGCPREWQNRKKSLTKHYLY